METAYSILRSAMFCKFVLALVTLMISPLASAAQISVTLRDGKTYQVQTVRGLPVSFANEQIKVQDLGILASFVAGKPETLTNVRELVADLMVKGQFTVTATSLLDPTAKATLGAIGPGRIRLHFFPQADYPRIWEGIDTPGVHWFPFHFVFENKQTGNRFEFTQWGQSDDKSWKQRQEMIEKAHRELKKQR